MKKVRFHRKATSSCFVVACALAWTRPSAADTTFYVGVSNSANDQNTGTDKLKPVRTLAKAVSLAKAQGGGTIKMTGGRYTESEITLPANVVVQGNWDTGFTTQDVFSVEYLRTLDPKSMRAVWPCSDNHTCIASSSDRVITITQPGTTLENLVVRAPDRSNIAGGNSYGLIIDGTKATLRHIIVVGGVGGYGQDGGNAGAATGFCSNGGYSGFSKTFPDHAWNEPFCETHDGGQGDSINLYGSTAKGGTGGQTGNSNCSMWPTAVNVSDGLKGNDGDLGIEGPPGIPGTVDNGAFAQNGGVWAWSSKVAGGTGQPGSAGGGGGGGGGGGSWNVLYWCCTGYPIAGGNGQVGNRGGCGGAGGQGGQSGGGSFALVVHNASVTFQDVAVVGGQGGKGGKGGNGAVGSVGGVSNQIGSQGDRTDGCWPYNVTQAGTGGPPGLGGKGGTGGGGAGGNGGPGFGIVKLGTGNKLTQSGVLNKAAGLPGAGGLGGIPTGNTKRAAPQGNDGPTSSEVTFESVSSSRDRAQRPTRR